MAKKIALVICDSATEMASAIGYWGAQGYTLLCDEQNDVGRVSVFEENAGPQLKWSDHYSGARVLLFMKPN